MLSLRRLLTLVNHQNSFNQPWRTITSTTTLFAKPLPPRPTINEDDITEAFLKGTGPGGQKINKTSSAVQLKHLPTGIVIKCQETRSRTQNRKLARRILAERVEELLMGDQSRSALKAERDKRKKASKSKKSNRKYRKLAEEGKEDDEGDENDYGEDQRNDAIVNKRDAEEEHVSMPTNHDQANATEVHGDTSTKTKTSDT